MSAIEQEIIEKFHQLDRDAQQRVKEAIEREANVKRAATLPQRGTSGKSLLKLAGGLSPEALEEMKTALLDTETIDPDGW